MVEKKREESRGMHRSNALWLRIANSNQYKQDIELIRANSLPVFFGRSVYFLEYDNRLIDNR